MTSSEEKRKKAASIVTALMVVAICIGTCWTILYSWQAKNLPQELSIIGVSSAIAGAFFISGLLLGLYSALPNLKKQRKKMLAQISNKYPNGLPRSLLELVWPNSPLCQVH